MLKQLFDLLPAPLHHRNFLFQQLVVFDLLQEKFVLLVTLLELLLFDLRVGEVDHDLAGEHHKELVTNVVYERVLVKGHRIAYRS